MNLNVYADTKNWRKVRAEKSDVQSGYSYIMFFNKKNLALLLQFFDFRTPLYQITIGTQSCGEAIYMEKVIYKTSTFEKALSFARQYMLTHPEEDEKLYEKT